jgi:hypothetical protein
MNIKTSAMSLNVPLTCPRHPVTRASDTRVYTHRP